MSLNNSDPDHVYYNINLVNTTNTVIQAQFADQKTQPILQDPSKYNVAIARASIPSASIPLFKFPDSSVPTNNQYWVTLVHTGSGDSYSTQLIYNNTSVFNDNLVYNLHSFLHSINTAFSTAATNLNTAHPGTIVNPPIVVYDDDTGIYSLLVDSGTFSNVQVWWNMALYLKFGSFYIYFNGTYNAADHKDVKFIFEDFGSEINTISIPGYMSNAVSQISIDSGGAGYIAGDIITIVGGDNNATVLVASVSAGAVASVFIVSGGSGYTSSLSNNTTGGTGAGAKLNILMTTASSKSYWQFSQTSSQPYSLLDLRALVFTSASLPIVNENISQYAPDPTSTTPNTLGSNQRLNIVGDLEPQVGTYRNLVQAELFQYQPSLLRLEALASNIPLTSVDMTVYWRSNTGELFPLYIYPGQSMNIKLAFVKKGLAS